MLLLLASLAGAQDDLDSRMALHEAMVLEGIAGDLDGAARRYLRLVRNQGPDDDTRSAAMPRLGRALYDLGRVEAARQALVDGRASGQCEDACRELLQLLVIEEEAITRTPVVWDFTESDHGFFHPLALQDLGRIKLERLADGTGVLQWETLAQTRRIDRLVIGLERPTPPPTEVALDITSTTVAVSLELVAIDEVDRRFALPVPLHIAIGERLQAVVALADLRSTDSSGPPLDPSRLTRLAMEVVGGQGTPNVLLIHGFAIR